jgi:hypothetical protein
MNRISSVALLLLLACGKKETTEAAPVPTVTAEPTPVVTAEPTAAPTTPTVVIAKKQDGGAPDGGTGPSVEDDFVDEATKDINAANMETELGKLEKEISP